MNIETATDVYASVLTLLAEAKADPRPGPHGASFDNGRQQALLQVLHLLEDDFGVLPRKAS